MNKFIDSPAKSTTVPTLDEINSLVAASETRDAKGYTEDEKRRINEGLNAAGWKAVTVSEFWNCRRKRRRSSKCAGHLPAHCSNATARWDDANRVGKKKGSSQSRIACVELGHPSVSLDLMVRAFLATGADQNDLARAIAV